MKILIYSYNDKIGDGLQKVTFIQQLKKIYPTSHITYTTTHQTTFKNYLNPLVRNYIDEIIEDNGIKSSLLNLFKKNKTFHNKSYDLIIDLQKVFLRTLQLKKIKNKGFFSATANFFFSSYKNLLNLPFKNIYIENFYMNILSVITNSPIKKIPNIILPKTNQNLIKLNKGSKLKIGIAPGAGDSIREWGFENYLNIAKYLRNEGFNIYFFLGPNEKKYLEECISNNFECPEWNDGEFISNNVLNIMNLAKEVDCLLCNDGGTSWMFEFAGVHTFKIFGITNERKFARPGYSTTIQVKEFGYTDIKEFPVDLYKKELKKFINKIKV